MIKKYKSRTVVKDVSVQVEQGEIVGLLGPNGAGKTTSFYMIVGLITPNGGRIFLDDQEITKEPVYKRAQLGVGYLAQEASVFRRLSVEDNIRAVLEMTKMTKEEQKDRLEEMLDEFGLQHIRKSRESSCREENDAVRKLQALSIRPKFILLDEPLPV
ncbi:MAG: ATP-binding cassette domain-containing protein [Odoribacter splanchnicus]